MKVMVKNFGGKRWQSDPVLRTDLLSEVEDSWAHTGLRESFQASLTHNKKFLAVLP